MSRTATKWAAVKVSLLESDKLAQVGPGAEALYFRLLLCTDPRGVTHGGLLRVAVNAYGRAIDEGTMTVESVKESLDALEAADLIRYFEEGRYLWVTDYWEPVGKGKWNTDFPAHPDWSPPSKDKSDRDTEDPAWKRLLDAGAVPAEACDIWEAFHRHRRQAGARKDLSEQSCKTHLKDPIGVMMAAYRRSIESGWQGYFPDRDGKGNGRTGGRPATDLTASKLAFLEGDQ